MADPFQDPDAAGPEFIKLFADSMEVRQSDPVMEAVVADYLSKLTFAPDGLTVETGAGAGAVTRRIAAHAAPARVLGYDPSTGFVAEARDRAAGIDNLAFEVADGAQLPLPDACADHVIMHTVLTHVPDPAALISEAQRVLKPGGHLVICDVDFSKASLASFANDPLDACAREFVRVFVTDPFVVGKLGRLIDGAGLTQVEFTVQSRVVSSTSQMLPWVDLVANGMQANGDISPEFAAALIAEHNRRLAAGTLYGYQAIATAIARRD
ncbi:class I SAM-dependent methyltransferase [Shimia biformata]|uniref:class I SAM-dependent methyltransferase n=1 Tax=Shimia biformata TaxID=1294299 RepID=UPI001950694D|nr:methyltransferase domain-containing protein [Shimia biformata]